MNTPLTEQSLREALVTAGKKLLKENLVQGTWGNISVRLDGENMLVTPSGLDYLRLTPADMVKVNINTLEYEGKLKPTSEKKLHASIYRDRTDIGAVIHTHSEYCSIMAAARAELPSDIPDIRGVNSLIGLPVRCAGYGLPGTKKMTNETLKALKDRNGCYLSNHGAIAAGESLDAALKACETLESSSKDYVTSAVLKRSGKDEFSDETTLSAYIK
ncbi:MAG: class II aldolase/adducin family protein [Clostridiales bacterium]|jgi:L-fuculose-phosphate aldolase|nr:class II aldolase/adducin family protein [Clostridiales bacterium]